MVQDVHTQGGEGGALYQLLVDNKVLSAGIAYAAVKLGFGQNFDAKVICAFTLFVAYICSTVFELDAAACAQVVFPLACALFALTSLASGVADILVLALILAALFKPQPNTFDGDALAAIFAVERGRKDEKPKTLWDKVVHRAQETLDDLVAMLATNAADVRFFDLHVATVARVSPPSGVSQGQPIYCVGVFCQWFNLNSVSPNLSAQLESYLQLHVRNAAPKPARNMLVRLPADAKCGQRLSTITPHGNTIEFVVPAAALPGTIIQLHY